MNNKEQNYQEFLIDWEQEKQGMIVTNYPNTCGELAVAIAWYANYWEDVDCVRTDVRIVEQLVEEFLANGRME